MIMYVSTSVYKHHLISRMSVHNETHSLLLQYITVEICITLNTVYQNCSIAVCNTILMAIATIIQLV